MEGGRIPWARRAWPILLGLLVLVPLGTALDGDARLVVEFVGAQEFRGSVEGSCVPALAQFPDGPRAVLRTEVVQGELRRYRTDYNRTWTNGESFDMPTKSSGSTLTVNGPVEIIFGARSRTFWTSPHLYAGNNQSLVKARFQSDGFHVLEHYAGPEGRWMQSAGIAPATGDRSPSRTRFPLWSPVVALGPGSLELEGWANVYLEDATLRLANGTEYRSGRLNDTQRQVNLGPLGRLEHVRDEYAYLRGLFAPSRMAAEGAHLRCSGFEAALGGALELAAAEGSLHGPYGLVPVPAATHRISGSFNWTVYGTDDHWFDQAGVGEPSPETLATPVRGSSRAEGSFEVEGLVLPTKGLDLGQIGRWSGLLAVAAAVITFASKGAHALFTRLSMRDLAGHPRRRLLLEAVRADPNVNLRTLSERTGLRKTAILYHARMLQGQGLLHSVRVAGERCFVATDSVHAHGRRLLDPAVGLLRHDAAVRAVLDGVTPEPVRLRSLLDFVGTHAGLSRPGAWKAVARAERCGLVRRSRIAADVWISRCTMESPIDREPAKQRAPRV